MKWLLFAALLFAGCEPAQIFEEPMIRQSRNPPVAPYSPHGIPQVIPTTPREGLWSGYNQLGYLAKYGPDQRNTQTILKMDEWGPPEMWTVSLYIKNDLKLFNGFYIKARINFGAGGSTQVVEIDWLNGAQISLPMNAINVQAIFEDVDVATEGSSLSVGVQLARGTRAGTTPPRLLLGDFTIPAITGGGVPGSIGAPQPLPAFAKNLLVIPSVPTLAQVAGVYSANFILTTNSGVDSGAFETGAVSGAQMANGVSLAVVGSARNWSVANFGSDILVIQAYAEIDG